jgi:phosphoribosylamine--glycine ligase
VVKADGLAAGKGVFVCRTQPELDAGLHAVRAFGGSFVVEELLEGDELSVLAISDGADALALPVARDYSPAGDGDTGPNTGGMGSFAPVRGYGPTEVEELVETIHRPVLAELAARDSPFVGCLYAGLMLTSEGPRVLEFNCRFGDPETQAVLPILADDVLEPLAAAAEGSLRGLRLPPVERAAVTVALTARDYPVAGDSGSPIEGVDEAERTGALVFHAGTARRDGTLVTNGGRILNVTAVADTVPEARDDAYRAVELIAFEGMRYRRDIGAELRV